MQEEDGGISLEGDKELEEENPKGHVTYGYHMVRGRMAHEMEDFVVAKKRNVNGKQLGLYAIFDGHADRDAAKYLQKNLFNNILNQVAYKTIFSDVCCSHSFKY